MIPTQSTEDGDYENRVKLVKYINYGGTYFYSGSADVQSNDWTVSTLNKEVLNEEYWESIKEYQQYIDPAKWYLGGVTWGTTTMEGYKTERSSLWCSEENKYTLAHIGLIYASDYGFATSGNEETDSREVCLNKRNWAWYGDCNYNDWLYAGYSKQNFAITKEVYSSVWGLHDEWINGTEKQGGLSTWKLNVQKSIYPTFYLKANVQYLNGTGEKTNPYRIMINE